MGFVWFFNQKKSYFFHGYYGKSVMEKSIGEKCGLVRLSREAFQLLLLKNGQAVGRAPNIIMETLAYDKCNYNFSFVLIQLVLTGEPRSTLLRKTKFAIRSRTTTIRGLGASNIYWCSYPGTPLVLTPVTHVQTMQVRTIFL